MHFWVKTKLKLLNFHLLFVGRAFFLIDKKYRTKNVSHFDIYSSKSSNPLSSDYEDFGLGESFVLNLLRVVEIPAKHAIYFDNYFTSFYLICRFNATGTIQEKSIYMSTRTCEIFSKEREGLLRFKLP